MAVRENIQAQKFSGTYRYFGDQTLPYTLTFIDSFQQSSIGHTVRSRKGNGDGGGGWFMEKTYHVISPAMSSNFWVTGPIVWNGPIGVLPVPDMVNLSHNDMVVQGTKAIKLTAPTNPSASAAQFLGELREGLPKSIGSGLLKEKTRFLKGSGNEYLNVEFGWKPLVDDVKDFAHAVRRSDEIIEAYRAGSNTKIRKRHAFDPVVNTSSYSGGGPCLPTEPIVMHSAQGTVTLISTSKSWFSGAFRYFVPTGSGTVDKLKQHVSNANHLLGTNITPELMWELAPWSWAADWFGNVGDVLHNISALGTDGLLMQYGYMMNSVENQEVKQFRLDDGGASGSVVRNHTFKVRQAASPYGFGVTFDGFSDRQKAIALAIGVTRK